MLKRKGILYVISGPSGSGKTTLCRRLADAKEAHYSISCTTRSPRPGEIHGTDYYFLSRDEFLKKIAQSEFLESAEVHGNLYGTLKSEVIQYLAQGSDVVMDLDVQGAAQVRACEDPDIRQSSVDLFVMPRSEEELLSRLSGRGTDPQEVIALRMKNALEEMQHRHEYTYCLLSGDREQDFQQFHALLLAERMRITRWEE